MEQFECLNIRFSIIRYSNVRFECFPLFQCPSVSRSKNFLLGALNGPSCHNQIPIYVYFFVAVNMLGVIELSIC